MPAYLEAGLAALGDAVQDIQYERVAALRSSRRRAGAARAVTAHAGRNSSRMVLRTRPSRLSARMACFSVSLMRV